MRQEKSDISLLLIILVLFSASIGLLHGFKFTLLSAANESNAVSLSPQDIQDIIFTQLSSDNIDKAADTLLQFNKASRDKALDDVLKKGQLSDNQKVMLLAALASKIEDATRKIELYKQLQADFSDFPLFALIVTNYPKLIESIRKWADASTFTKWKNKSLVYALQHDDVPLFTSLYTHGLRLDKKEASLILDRVVTNKRNVGFVPLLVRIFGADVSYSKDGKKTVLIKAVESKNIDMIRALMDAGANPHHVVDPSTGSAMQAAHRLNLHDVEHLLGKY